MNEETFDGFVEMLRREPLPQRTEEPCAYCGKPDCTERFDHDRWARGNEDTWRRR